ncbi:MAG TPA: hypothetical protein VJ103_02405 [Candidatus Paceibacterota bacterium]|nr:hypothetical protein [Candidatus Paceibacterota bacterium]
MKKINSFLEKFKKLLDLDEENKKIITTIIYDHTKEKISPKDMKINGKILYLKQNPYTRRVIYLKKEKILKTLKNSLINLLIEDIK